MKLRIYNRDFSSRVQPEVQVSVNNLSWERLGGCKEMSVTLSGEADALIGMIHDLRCPVEIYGDGGMAVWWGYIFEVTLNYKGVTYGNSLDRLYNRARVRYTLPGSTTEVDTSWAEDAASIATFGYKEYHVAMSEVLADVAVLKRTAILTNFANPTPSFTMTSSGSGDAVRVNLLCRGWADTLNWQYVDSPPPVVGVEYADLGTERDGVNDPVFQQFTIPAGSNQTMREVAIYANMFALDGVSFPTDNLLVEIYALSGGYPTGAALATATIAPGSLNGYNGVYVPTEAERIVVAFAAPVELTASTMYGLRLSRSDGPAGGDNYFVVMTNSALGYSGGVYRRWNSVGSTWDSASPDVDLVFTLYSDEWEGLARQIAELVATYGQFITGVADLSGCLAGEVQKAFPGDTTTWQVLKDYMELGGVNGRELSLIVDLQRRIGVAEEPASTAGATYLLGLDGKLMSLAGTEIELSDLWGVCGQFVAMRDDQFAELSAVSLASIEEVQWTPGRGVRVIFKGQIRVEDLGL